MSGMIASPAVPVDRKEPRSSRLLPSQGTWLACSSSALRTRRVRDSWRDSTERRWALFLHTPSISNGTRQVTLLPYTSPANAWSPHSPSPSTQRPPGELCNHQSFMENGVNKMQAQGKQQINISHIFSSILNYRTLKQSRTVK